MIASVFTFGADGRLGGRRSGLRPRSDSSRTGVRSGSSLRARSLLHPAKTPACLLGLTLVTCVASVAWAQPGLPAPAAAAQPAPAETAPPAAAPAAPAEAAATTDASVAAPAPEAAPARSEDEIFRERLALERERLRLMLARARMTRPLPQTRPTDEDPVVHGDAGAPFAIAASLEQLWYVDESYDVFAKDNVTPRFGAWASYDLLSLRPSVILAGELGWGYESEDAYAFGSQLDTKLRTHTFDGGVRVRWVPIDFLQPHIRVAGGVGWVRANLSIANASVDSKSDELLPFASAGLGFLLRTPTRSFENKRGDLASLSLGVMFEAGYTQAMGLDVAFHAKRDQRAVDLSEPNLGTLERSGPYLRTSFVVGF